MTYWGGSATVSELSRLMRNPDSAGTFSVDFPYVARSRGFKATPISGTIGRIKRAIDRNVPPVIMVASGGGQFHFYVVSGYSDRDRTIVCEEYDDQKLLIGYDELDSVWKPALYTLIEIEIPPAHDLFEDATDFESRGKWDEAAPLYRAAIKASPDLYEARVGLANCLLFMGKSIEARDEYRRAHSTNPTDPKVCNNLANVLVSLGEELEEAERLAGGAVDQYDGAWRRASEDRDTATDDKRRATLQREAAERKLDLAHSLGTLGQARAANGRHVLAIAAWKASLGHLPLTAFDFRAKRLLEMGLSCGEIDMPAEGRGHLRRALSLVKSPALRERIEAALK